MQSSFDVKAIKTANPLLEYCRNHGIELCKAAAAGEWRGCCPVHKGDNRSAFLISESRQTWHCFTGCQAGGDVIQLDMLLHGGTFPDACRRLGGQAQHAPSAPRPRPAPVPAPPPEEDVPLLPAADRQFAALAAKRLAKDSRLLQQIAARRGWKPETLRNLCLECSIGWHEGRFLFITERGIKQRWQKDGERHFSFLRGKAGLWRRHELELRMRNPGKPSRLILTEGETDAISLIDAGAENDGETCVLALPCASGWKAVWLPLFAGVKVVLALDADPAGQKATAGILPQLRGVAAEINVVNLKGGAA